MLYAVRLPFSRKLMVFVSGSISMMTGRIRGTETSRRMDLAIHSFSDLQRSLPSFRRSPTAGRRTIRKQCKESSPLWESSVTAGPFNR